MNLSPEDRKISNASKMLALKSKLAAIAFIRLAQNSNRKSNVRINDVV